MERKLTLNDIKKVSLDILISIHEYCKANGIKYSLGYGTMLGAVRHKGFIPWDDDIDILMMREDYDRFLSGYKDSKFEVIDHKREKKYILPYAKVVDKNTVLFNSWMPDLKLGVSVDVFPVDYVGKYMDEAEKLYNKKSLWGKLFLLKVLDFRWRGYVKSSFLIFAKLLLLPLSKSFLCNKLMAFANKNVKETDNGIWGVVVAQDSFLRESFNYHVYSDIRTISFEGRQFDCLAQTDTYLNRIYGNYMELPPEDKRVSTHDSDAYYI